MRTWYGGQTKFELFTLDKDSTFTFGILSNLINGLEILSAKGDGLVLVLATSFLESIFAESWFNCSAIVLRMAFVQLAFHKPFLHSRFQTYIGICKMNRAKKILRGEREGFFFLLM